MTGIDRPEEPMVLRFQTTAKASAYAHSLAHPTIASFDLLIDALALILGVALIASGTVVLGLALLVVAGLWILDSRFHWLQRAVFAIRFRSVLGRTTEVTVDDEGLRFENPLGSSFVPWSSMTDVRSNRETVAFFRSSLLLGYVPASAFDSAATRAHLTSIATTHIVSR